MRDLVGVVEDSLFECVKSDGAVHGASIEVGKRKAGGELKSSGRFTGTSGSIYGYDQVGLPFYKRLTYISSNNLGNLGNFSGKRI